ncbi:S41 family peptidase [Pedobacter nutrimenti]|uniref:S41 family peptidase n=1 Tax=Pedobacter nutrimenti TaxID=1241337 RepID=UPI0029306B54|nr:S41 family peptidase [Pedobacter nutrimenti]
MKTNFVTGRLTLFGLFLLCLAASSCKKNHATDTPDQTGNTTVPANGTRTQLTLDSLFLYAKQIYYWNDAIPDYATFQPRNYISKSLALDNYDDELFAITQLKINPSTGKPYEFRASDPTIPKYSYIDDITTHNAQQAFVPNATADVELDGTGYDVGFLTFQGYGTNTSYDLYVTAVFPNSPAAKAGLTRGSIIKKINGTAIGTNFNTEKTIIYAIPESTTASVTLSGTKADGTVFNDLVLTRTKYASSPVYKTTTITSGAKKIGYLALARFSDLETTAKKDLDNAFSKFVSDGVTDLIIDLRYNGGGYVNTAEYLVNLIAPSSAKGKMFTEYYNSNMQSGKATILSNQPLLDANDKVQTQNGKIVTYADLDYTAAGNVTSFAKAGSLNNVTNVVFIVSGNTASASELVINSLKPVSTVKLVGTQTYGKPVGFFPVRLENKYDVYMSLFETKNALDQGGYFSGFTPDIVDVGNKTVFDDSTHDFGDVNESYTKNAISLLVPAAPVTTANAVMSIRGKSVAVSSALGLPGGSKEIRHFMGMIETKHKRKN